MLGLKLNHVSKRGPCTYQSSNESHWLDPPPHPPNDTLIKQSLYWYNSITFLVSHLHRCLPVVCPATTAAEQGPLHPESCRWAARASAAKVWGRTLEGVLGGTATTASASRVCWSRGPGKKTQEKSLASSSPGRWMIGGSPGRCLKRVIGPWVGYQCSWDTSGLRSSSLPLTGHQVAAPPSCSRWWEPLKDWSPGNAATLPVEISASTT